MVSLPLLIFILGYLCGFILSIAPILLWVIIPIKIKASNYGLKITSARIIGVFLRRSPRKLIVDTLIELKRDGYDIDLDQVEAAYLMNPHTSKTVRDLKRHVLKMTDTN
jgi:uncharacterized protein YqfA (UPF0365 family)